MARGKKKIQKNYRLTEKAAEETSAASPRILLFIGPGNLKIATSKKKKSEHLYSQGVVLQYPYSSCAQILHKNANFAENAIPVRIQSFSQSLYNPDYGAFIHFFEEEKNCSAYKNSLDQYADHLRKFKGVFSLDNSIEWGAPLKDQIKANSLNIDSQKYFQQQGIACIRNVRFGDAKSYPFCFSEITEGATLIIGSHGTQRRKDYKIVLIAGACSLVESKKPDLLLVYGKVPEMLVNTCILSGTSLVRYPSQCEIAHMKR